MKLSIAATILLLAFTGFSAAFAQDRASSPLYELLLTPHQARAYHACLFEAWIQDYCRWNSPGYARVQCLAANGAGQFPLDGHWVSNEYCWSAAQGFAPR